MPVCSQFVLNFINLFFQLLYQLFECLNSLVVIRMLMAVFFLGHISSHDLRECSPCWRSVSNEALNLQSNQKIIWTQSVGYPKK
jgi:hypothetical protein